MSGLKLYNSLSRKKESFTPIDDDHVRLYACGPTVYSYAHIGNGRMAVVFDLLVTLLRHQYKKVTYVSNITDVDDKIIQASEDTGQDIDEITTKYAHIYNEDMTAMGVALPDVQPLATKHIKEMIALVETLIAKGHAYESEGHVLFDVPSYPAYGSLAGRSQDKQLAGARVDVSSYKRDPSDFILWKPSVGNQPAWDSPWGRGRPGWHLECSAMAEKHLGLPFDIHGGGADLKFPHHENEIAQSCCAHDAENDPFAFAKYWVHNGFVTVAGEKMAKSVGNFRLVHDLLDVYDGEVLRLTLLSAHYRQPLDWSEKTLAQNKSLLEKFYQYLHNHPVGDDDDAIIPDEFMDALNDDLNTPAALAVLSRLIKDSDDTASVSTTLMAMGRLLGILQKDPATWLGYGQTSADDAVSAAYIDDLVVQRTEARKNKDFARADEIRDELTSLKIVVEDTDEGPKWRMSQ